RKGRMCQDLVLYADKMTSSAEIALVKYNAFRKMDTMHLPQLENAVNRLYISGRMNYYNAHDVTRIMTPQERNRFRTLQSRNIHCTTFEQLLTRKQYEKMISK